MIQREVERCRAGGHIGGGHATGSQQVAGLEVVQGALAGMFAQHTVNHLLEELVSRRRHGFSACRLAILVVLLYRDSRQC